MKCTAIISPEQGKVAFEEQEVKAPTSDELLIKCVTSIISRGTERAFILNLPGVNAKYPMHGMGYASAGIVEAVGEGVTRFKPGDRVATKMSHRSYGIIKENRAALLPDSVSFRDAAFTTLGAICLQGVRKARIELGETVMVIGLGLIGQLTTQLVKLAGAYPSICGDIVEEKINTAKKCGADIGINTGKAGWQETLSGLLKGKAPSVVIESTGFPAPISDALDVAARLGRVVLLGSTRGESTIDFYKQVHKKGIQIIGAHISTIPDGASYPAYWTYNDNMCCFAELLASGKIITEPLVQESIPVADALEAFERMLHSDNQMLATVIDWQ